MLSQISRCIQKSFVAFDTGEPRNREPKSSEQFRKLYVVQSSTYPVLDVELPEIAVRLHGAAGHFLHEGGELQRLGDEGAANRSEVLLGLTGQGEVVPAQRQQGVARTRPLDN